MVDERSVALRQYSELRTYRIELRPCPGLQIEAVHVVEVLVLSQIVVETSKHDQLFLDTNHSVTTTR